MIAAGVHHGVDSRNCRALWRALYQAGEITVNSTHEYVITRARSITHSKPSGTAGNQIDLARDINW